MDVLINVIKPTEFIADLSARLSLEEQDGVPPICTLNFSPTVEDYTPKFKDGFYRYDDVLDAMFDDNMYYLFRWHVCESIHGNLGQFIREYKRNNRPHNKAFAVFLCADNLCFDYVMAQDLLKDFEDYRDVLCPKLKPIYKAYYDQYISLLRCCVKIKGVVYYSSIAAERIKNESQPKDKYVQVKEYYQEAFSALPDDARRLTTYSDIICVVRETTFYLEQHKDLIPPKLRKVMEERIEKIKKLAVEWFEADTYDKTNNPQ